MVTIPQNRSEQQFIYKSVDGRDIPLLFYPPTTEKFDRAPLWVLIPGGGWSKSVAESMYGMERAAAEALRAEGFAVAALSYRNNRDDGVNMRAMVADIFDGTAYLAKYAAVLGLDPTRFYSSGHSAGGHLALLLAYAPCDLLAAERVYDDPFTVRASAPMSPPTALTRGDPCPGLRFGVEHLFVGCTDEDYALCSPQWWAEQGHGVASIIAVGSSDDLVFPENGRRLCETLTAAGVKAELLVSQDGGHCFEPINAPSSSPNIMDIQKSFVDFLLKVDAAR